MHTPGIWKWSPRGAHTPGAIAETRILQRCNHQGRKQAAGRIKKSVDYERVGGRVEGMRHANQAEAMPRETLWSWNLNLREEKLASMWLSKHLQIPPSSTAVPDPNPAALSLTISLIFLHKSLPLFLFSVKISFLKPQTEKKKERKTNVWFQWERNSSHNPLQPQDSLK